MDAPFPGMQQLVAIREEWEKAVDLERWDDAFLILDQALDVSYLRLFEHRSDEVKSYLCYLKGHTHYRIKQWRLATKWYIKNLRIDPNNPVAWSSLSDVFEGAGKSRWASLCRHNVEDPMLQIVDELRSS